MTTPTQTVSPWLVPPFRFITGVLAPLPLGKPPSPQLVGGWDSASLPPLDLWQFLLPAADWYPTTIQHLDWYVNLRGEHTLTSRLRGVLFPPAKLSSEDPDFNIRPPTPCPALAATLDFPQTDIPSWPVCSCPEPPGGGGHLGPHCRCEGSHQTPWAAMGCEYSARREQAPGRVSSHRGLSGEESGKCTR